MRTKAEAESRLARCALLRPVVVADVDVTRRSYTFANPNGDGETTVEIDAAPTDRQLQDLALHVPILARDRAATLAIFREP